MTRSIALVLALLPSLALAQAIDTTATSGSQSGASTNTRVDNALTLNTEQLPVTTVRTAPGIGLAATTNSFSSDYCGGTAQVGGSSIGFSIGVTKQVQDARCNARRDAAFFGQLAAQYHNFGQAQQRDNAQAMAAFIVCASDPRYTEACRARGWLAPAK